MGNEVCGFKIANASYDYPPLRWTLTALAKDGKNYSKDAVAVVKNKKGIIKLSFS